MGRAIGPVSSPPAAVQHILLIEDDAWIRRFLRDVLSDNGYLVGEAADGRTGLRLAAQSRPDLILLDLAMPEVTGVDVLRELRAGATTRDVPVLVISAYTRVLPESDVAGVAGVLQKPLDLDVLLERVREALRHSGGGR